MWIGTEPSFRNDTYRTELPGQLWIQHTSDRRQMHHALETEIIELEQVEIRTHAAASDSSWHLAEAKAWLADSIIEFGLGIDSINLVAVF